jgi:hypothetical protein
MRAAYLVMVFAVAAGGCTSPVPSDPGTPSAVPAASPAVCVESTPAPLPEWARGGFSGDAVIRHVMSDRGDIVAVLFGYPLSQPPPPDRSNKILWVSRVPVEPGDRLVIDARNQDGGAATREVAGGPGPSIIDLPRAGCWELTLTWSGHRDAMRLRYVPG